MLHLGMNLPFYLMALYGSIMIVMVFILRALLKNKLPKFVFPALWSIVLLRFLIPFSISTPLSIPVPANPYGLNETEMYDVALVEEKDAVISEAILLPGTAHNTSQQEAVFTTPETVVVYEDSVRPPY